MNLQVNEKNKLTFNFSTSTFYYLIKHYWTLGDYELLRAVAEKAQVEFHEQYGES